MLRRRRASGELRLAGGAGRKRPASSGGERDRATGGGELEGAGKSAASALVRALPAWPAGGSLERQLARLKLSAGFKFILLLAAAPVQAQPRELSGRDGRLALGAAGPADERRRPESQAWSDFLALFVRLLGVAAGELGCLQAEGASCV